MNWTTAGTVPMSQMKMMSFRAGLLQALDLWQKVSEIGEHPLKWGYYFTLLIRDTSPF